MAVKKETGPKDVAPAAKDSLPAKSRFGDLHTRTYEVELLLSGALVAYADGEVTSVEWGTKQLADDSPGSLDLDSFQPRPGPF